MFWSKFVQKSYFQSQTNKIDCTVEFCVFELAKVPNFTLNKQFWLFGANFPKKDIPSLKQKINCTNEFCQISVGTKFQV